jgi:hypothetical protein
MVAPSASIVEAAADSLLNKEWLTEHQAILEEQASEIRSAFPNKSEDFYNGYALGLMTARVLLLGMPNAVIHKVEI